MVKIYGDLVSHGKLAQSLLGRGTYPHSGTQIAIFVVIVVVLLVGGILLWYFSHPRKRKDQ